MNPIDPEATPHQRRYLQGLLRRWHQQQPGRSSWFTKHLFGRFGFTLTVAGDCPHMLSEFLLRCRQLTLEKTFHKEGLTYAYFLLDAGADDSTQNSGRT